MASLLAAAQSYTDWPGRGDVTFSNFTTVNNIRYGYDPTQGIAIINSLTTTVVLEANKTLRLPSTVNIGGKSYKIVGISYLNAYGIDPDDVGHTNERILNNLLTPVENVILPEYLELIEQNIFDPFTHVSTLSIPGTLREVRAENLFNKMTALRTLRFEDGVDTLKMTGGYYWNYPLGKAPITTLYMGRNIVTTRGDGLCSYSETLTTLQLGGGVSVEYGAFYSCPNLTTVTRNAGSTITTEGSIGMYAFQYCYKLAKVEIPNTITKIDEKAFASDTLLANIDLGNGVKLIGSEAFANNYRCQSLTLPASLDSIYVYAFTNMTALKNVTVEDNSRALKIGGARYGGTAVFGDSPLETLHYGRNIDAAYGRLANAVPTLKTVTMSNYVTQLRSDPDFYNCTGLQSVTLSKNLTEIPASTFNNCYSLTSITIPDKVTKIGNNAFRSDTLLANIDLGHGVKVIGSEAFAHNYSCRSLTLPASLDSIEVGAFVEMTALKHVTMEDDARALKVGGARYGGTAVFGNSPLETLHYGRNIDGDYGRLAHGIATLKTVTMSDYVTQLHPSSDFYSCTGLQSITLSKNITEIPASTFNNCYSLTSITIPDKVTKIGNNAFRSDTLLANIDLGNGVKVIGNEAFAHNYSCQSLTLPASLDSIEVGAFAEMTALKHVTVEDDARALKVGGARYGGTAVFGDSPLETLHYGRNIDGDYGRLANSVNTLKTVHVGKNVTYLHKSGDFYNCTGLQEIYSHATVPPTVQSSSEFGYVDKQNCSLYVPRGKVNAYKAATGWKDFFRIEEIRLRGDVGGDGKVDVADVNEIINLILKLGGDATFADVNKDGKIDVADVNIIINIILKLE